MKKIRLNFSILFVLSILLLACAGSKETNADNNTNNNSNNSNTSTDTKLDAWTAYDAFNASLLDKTTHIYKKNSSTADGASSRSRVGAIWTQAIYWDMSMNAYKLAVKVGDTKRQTKYKDLISTIFNGDKSHYVNFNWHDQNSETGWFIYDDIMWWTIANARAYELLKDETYLTLADESFCRVWYGSYLLKDRGSYDKTNGGMFWNWNTNNPPDNSDNGKMSCINFPTVIAAMTLYNGISSTDTKHQADDGVGFNNDSRYPRWLSRSSYLAKAKEIYAWAIDHLYNKSTGCVADNCHGSGIDWTTTVYNQGTFIGASCLLYRETKEAVYLNNAIMAATYTRDEMSSDAQILPYKNGEEQGIYTAIFAQYMAMLVYDCGQIQFLPWLRKNIKLGWGFKNKKDLTGKNYADYPDDPVSCYDASGIPALMLLFPPDDVVK